MKTFGIVIGSILGAIGGIMLGVSIIFLNSLPIALAGILIAFSGGVIETCLDSK
jgi:hypothetical protein